MSAFTITVIAVDRWCSVCNTNPNDALTYKTVFIVIGALWACAFVGESNDEVNVVVVGIFCNAVGIG